MYNILRHVGPIITLDGLWTNHYKLDLRVFLHGAQLQKVKSRSVGEDLDFNDFECIKRNKTNLETKKHIYNSLTNIILLSYL